MNDHPKCGGARRFRVLLVDDDPWMLRIMTAALAPSAEVATAASAELALRLLEARDFDVVCSDLLMPGMGGAELLRIVAEEHPTARRLLATAASDAVGLDLDADWEILVKPFDPEGFAEIIERLASEAQARSEHSTIRAIRRPDAPPGMCCAGPPRKVGGAR